MEKRINLHIEKLPEGFYLATSTDVQGLVAQGRTIAETVEIAEMLSAVFWRREPIACSDIRDFI